MKTKLLVLFVVAANALFSQSYIVDSMAIDIRGEGGYVISEQSFIPLEINKLTNEITIDSKTGQKLKPIFSNKVYMDETGTYTGFVAEDLDGLFCFVHLFLQHDKKRGYIEIYYGTVNVFYKIHLR
jgi:hypothetical protein